MLYRLELTPLQVWIADVTYGLLAFNAVPVNGVLTQINLPTSAATGGLTHYQRVVFGNGRVYTVKASTLIMLTGGGVTLSPPVTCTPNPVSFGSLLVSQTSTVQVTCTANTAITNPACSISSTIFQCGPATLPSTVASGGTFTFPVVSSKFPPNLSFDYYTLTFSSLDIQFE
jgi:iron transport multicopper oxidase